MINFEEARSALSFLDPSCPRNEWVCIGMALKAGGLSFEDFHSWSKDAPNYTGEKDCLTAWKSFDETGDITAATLFHKACEGGWKNAKKPHHHTTKMDYSNTKHKNESIHREETEARENLRALDIWERCLPALETHGYIIRKQGKPDGLRYYPSAEPTLTIGGINISDYLVVPCISNGKLQTLQFIPPDSGKKLNLDGGEFHNGYFIVGQITNTIYVCEGLSAAWPVNKVSGAACVVCFGAHRMMTVAKALRSQYPSAHLVIVPDRGQENTAANIAIEVATNWVELPREKPKNYDVGDYGQEHGYEALASLLADTKTPESRYKLLSADEVCNSPPMNWIVKGIIPKIGLTALYGPSGSGKSFLLLDLALTIATGESLWFGRRINAVPITYVCLEGESGLGKRVKAWFTHANKALPKKIRFITQPFNLLTDDMEELAKAIVLAGHTGGMIILDTLNRAAPGADENSPVDMGKIISSSSQLQRLTSGMVLLAHHTGKDETKKLRGHSSLPAALDGAIEVTRIGTGRQWMVAKSKDDKDGDTYPFKLEIMHLGIDKEDDEITSCVVIPCDGDSATSRFKEPKSGNQKIIWDALGKLFKQSPYYGKGDAPAMKACLEYEFALENTMDVLPCDKKRQKERAKAAMTALVSNGFLRSKDGWLWTP